MSVTQNVQNCFDLREKIIDSFRDFFFFFFFLLSEAKWKTKYGNGLKILIPKQLLQGLPIALAHVKAGNRSEKTLN